MTHTCCAVVLELDALQQWMSSYSVGDAEKVTNTNCLAKHKKYDEGLSFPTSTV